MSTFYHLTRVSERISFFLVCTFPLEYCEFGSSLTRCKEWLQGEHPQLFDKYYSDGEHIHSATNYRLIMLIFKRLSSQRSVPSAWRHRLNSRRTLRKRRQRLRQRQMLRLRKRWYVSGLPGSHIDRLKSSRRRKYQSNASSATSGNTLQLSMALRHLVCYHFFCQRAD